MRRMAMAALPALLMFALTACASKEKFDAAAMQPPPAKVVEEPDLNIVKVDRPERFKLVTAGEWQDLPEVHATGTVNPDVEKSVPAVSLAAGRVIGIYAKLGDDVTEGQLLLKILSNDISNAFQTYEQAKADEALALKQLERAKLLYEHGAMSLNDLQVAEDTEEKARVSMKASAQQIRTLGGDPNHEDAVVNVYAPVSGTIVEQNVVLSSNVHTPDNQANLFTIANLSTVWVICDVYENDLPIVRLGDTADVRLNAYPDRVLRGRISNIGKLLDATIRTAKVRIELPNPGIMRAGMFVTATFYALRGQTYPVVPTGAILHLHDREWVFVPSGTGQFRRTEVTAGKLIDGQQEILSGISPGTQVVSDALALEGETGQ
ncbi:MAG: efflux RND transporter periplasmic adaptor subunit [Acidobacteriaceae bacterium]|nr:efflux RND transporter periplasmic adaptor subunit [Acidobacteriaceae bacterium]